VGERQRIDGWAVAEAALERSWSQREQADTVWLFRSPTAWTVVGIARCVRYDDHGEPVAGSATVAAEVFSGLDQVGDHVERTYVAGSWVQLLDAGHDHDDELYRAWVPERIGRDFDQASIHNRDLAEAAGYLDARSLPTPGRALPDWREHALEAMAARVQELGYDLVGRQEPGATAAGPERGRGRAGAGPLRPPAGRGRPGRRLRGDLPALGRRRRGSRSEPGADSRRRGRRSRMTLDGAGRDSRPGVSRRDIR